jgi:serine/threonine-protein kinase
MSDAPERVAAALAERYAIERELGSGGMARVYRACDLKHGRQVAVKVLRADLAAAIGSERFLREIRITAGSTTLTSFRCSIPARLAAFCTT